MERQVWVMNWTISRFLVVLPTHLDFKSSQLGMTLAIYFNNNRRYFSVGVCC